MKEKDINSLDHTSWRCQYHVVFAPKYRRQVIYREIKVDRENTEKIMRTKRSRNNRSRIMSRPCAYAHKYTA